MLYLPFFENSTHLPAFFFLYLFYRISDALSGLVKKLEQANTSTSKRCIILVAQLAKNGRDLLDNSTRAGAGTCAALHGLSHSLGIPAENLTAFVFVLQLAGAPNESVASDSLPLGESAASNSLPLGESAASDAAPTGASAASNSLPLGESAASNAAPTGASAASNAAPTGASAASNTAPTGASAASNPPPEEEESVGSNTPGEGVHPDLCVNVPSMVPGGPESKKAGQDASRLWLRMNKCLIEAFGLQIDAYVPVVPMAAPVLHDLFGSDVTEYSAAEYLSAETTHALHPELLLGSSSTEQPKVFPAPYPVCIVSKTWIHTSGLAAAGAALLKAVRETTVGRRVGLEPRLNHLAVVDALMRGTLMGAAATALVTALLKGFLACGVVAGAIGGDGPSVSFEARCAAAFKSMHSYLCVLSAADRTFRNSVEPRAIIAGGKIDDVAAALFIDNSNDTRAIYPDSGRVTSDAKIRQLFAVFSVDPEAKTELDLNLVNEAWYNIVRDPHLVSRLKEAIVAEMTFTPSETIAPLATVVTRALGASCLVRMGDGGLKPAKCVKVDDFLAQPNAPPAKVRSISRFRVPTSELCYFRSAYGDSGIPDADGNKRSDDFRPLSVVTKYAYTLVSPKGFTNGHTEVKWATAEDVCMRETRMKQAMEGLSADEKNAAYKRAIRQIRPWYVALVTCGSRQCAKKALRIWTDHVERAWTEAGCELPEGEELKPLLLNTCRFLTKCFGDGIGTGGKIVVSSQDKQQMEYFFQRFVPVLGGHFEVHTHDRKDGTFLVSFFLSLFICDVPLFFL
jgi:hypothetical protein